MIVTPAGGGRALARWCWVWDVADPPSPLSPLQLHLRRMERIFLRNFPRIFQRAIFSFDVLQKILKRNEGERFKVVVKV